MYGDFTTSHPQQGPVDSTCTGTDYVNQLNTEMNGNFILGTDYWKTYGGGGGLKAGKVQKKYSRKGKLNEKKIHARQLILKNIHAMA